MKTDIEAAEEKTSCQDLEEVTSHEMMTNPNKDIQETPLETVCASETISMALEAIPSVPSPRQANRSTPAKKTRRGAQVRTAQKSQEHQMDSDSLSDKVARAEEDSSAESVKSVSSLRGRRGKLASELKDVSVQSPVRKSTRGRIPKGKVEAQKSSCAFAEDVQLALKPRRGRKAEHDVEDLQEGPVTDPKASVAVEASTKSPVPARAKGGRKGKHELENPQEPEAVPEASVEEVRVASESAGLQNEAPAKSNPRARRGRARKEPTMVAEVEETTDIKTPHATVEVRPVVLKSSKIESGAENEDSLKSTAKTRRGRFTKKEMPRTSQVEVSSESTPTVVESDDKSSNVIVALVVEPKLPESTDVQSVVETEDPIKPNSKPRRGRATKKQSPATTQDEESSKRTSDSEVLSEELTEMPVVKSRRGRRVNPVVDESNVEPHAVESQAKLEVTAVRSSRGARNKQLKLQVEHATNGPATETISTAAVTEKPAAERVVKNVRGGRKTKQPKAQVLDDSQEEAQDKPSIDSETIQQLEAPGARSARGKRLAAVKDEPEAPVKRGCRAATIEVPPPVVKSTRGRKAAAKSEPKVSEEATIVVEPVKETTNETRVSGSETEETPLAQADSKGVGVVVPKKGRGRIAKKAQVSPKDNSVSEAEEPAVEEEPRRKSKKKDKPTAKDDTETKQSVFPPVTGRKEKGVKKQEEPEVEKQAVKENVQPVRRGRAGASVVSQHDEVANCPKRGPKRKAVEDVVEETPDTESLTKRKRGKGIYAEDQPSSAVPSKGKRVVAKVVQAEEPPKKEEKPVRGRRKATQEDVPDQAEDPVSGKLSQLWISNSFSVVW